MDEYKYLFKVVLIGNAGVGKTCIVTQFTEHLFPPGQIPTIGVDFRIKTVDINKEIIKLQIWDTAGQERFKSITQSYYRSANAIILVYDICCLNSFDSLPQWMNDIEKYGNSSTLVYLVGNKSDRTCDREVLTSTGEVFAEHHGLNFRETSAKDCSNIDLLFKEIAKELTEKSFQNAIQPDNRNPQIIPSSDNCSKQVLCCRMI